MTDREDRHQPISKPSGTRGQCPRTLPRGKAGKRGQPPLARLLLAFWAAALLTVTAASAQQAPDLPVDVTFLVSGGYWEESGSVASNGIVKVPGLVDGKAKARGDQRRGFYRLFALRQPDRTSKVFLQQVEVKADRRTVIDTVELQEFTTQHAYVTDIRSDDPSGVNRGLGLTASVYVKTNPEAEDADSWSVVVDDFGEIRVERESH